MNTNPVRKSAHPEWVQAHRKPNTEIKLINGNYYLYGVKSVYDKTLKRLKKISLGIFGSVTQRDGFVPSGKQSLKAKSEKTYHNREILAVEYVFSRWLIATLNRENIVQELQKHFPVLWQFIIVMVYNRVAYQSPLKNIPFWSAQSDLQDILQVQKFANFPLHYIKN